MPTPSATAPATAAPAAPAAAPTPAPAAGAGTPTAPLGAVPVSRAGGTLNPSAAAESHKRDDTATRALSNVAIKVSLVQDAREITTDLGI